MQIFRPLLCDNAALLDPARLPRNGPLLFGPRRHSRRQTSYGRRPGHLVGCGYRFVGDRQPNAGGRHQLDALRLSENSSSFLDSAIESSTYSSPYCDTKPSICSLDIIPLILWQGFVRKLARPKLPPIAGPSAAHDFAFMFFFLSFCPSNHHEMNNVSKNNLLHINIYVSSLPLPLPIVSTQATFNVQASVEFRKQLSQEVLTGVRI